MASLHEYHHGSLNDCTAYGSLLHVVGWLCREQPDEPRHLDLLDALIEHAVTVHEAYATYSSLYLVGRGWPDPGLLTAYPEYSEYLTRALAPASRMPNPVLAFRFVQAIARAAMQSELLCGLAASSPNEWDPAAIAPGERPDERFDLLCRPESLDDLADEFAGWASAQRSSAVREVLDARPRDEQAYDRLIEARLDAATDSIATVLYDLCSDRLRDSGRSCLDFDGHQSLTHTLVARAESWLPGTRRGRPMSAAVAGSGPADVASMFAEERLVVTPGVVRGSWIWLDEVDEGEWLELLVGPTPHALLVVRPSARVCEQFDFGDHGCPPIDQLGTICALRRRVVGVDHAPLIDHALIRTPAQLARLAQRVAGAGRLLSSCSMSVLGEPEWQRTWLATMRDISYMSVLVDLNPFEHLRAWAAQAEFETSSATINVAGDDKQHIVFALRPETGDELTYLAPCTAICSSALRVCLADFAAAGARFVERSSFVEHDIADLNLTLSHLLREEPWFDFLGGRPTRSI
jgi:hypothetical protein